MRANTSVFTGAGLMLVAACSNNPAVAPPQAVIGGQAERPHAGAPLSYPDSMLRAKQTADVDIGCNVDTTGHTHDCGVLSLAGNPDAAKAALSYVSRARYAPRTHNGVPIATYHVWHIHFRLSQPARA